ncbi:MAG: hypothetical protein IAF94_02630, partial [Pirellulaceae bacterium]|nr:hypothetical protein [Pirellulaceae bacterium]
MLAGVAWADPSPDPTGIPPSPAALACAKANGLALGSIELAGATAESRPGDRLTVLFTIHEGADTRQWVAEFRATALTDREARSKPGSGLGLLGVFQSSLKTDTGHEYSFPQTPAALEVRTFGPFAGNGAAP